MAKFKPQHRRLLFIDVKIREGNYPNCNSLAAEWETSAKTIQRDIEYMRDQLDAPIAYDALRHGYYYTERNFSLPSLSISESDLFAVLVAERALRQFRNTPVYARLASFFDKVQESLPDKTEIHPAWVDERILFFPEPTTTVNPDTWDAIARALRNNQQITLQHAGPGETGVIARTVDPYYLVNYRGEWYLSSFCHERKAIRTFALSRIRKVEAREQTFAMPPDMTPERMFGDPFGIIWKDTFSRVRIRFAPGVAPYIEERRWHPRQTIRKQRDGSLVLEFTTNHLNEVKDWVMSWGAGARVLAPPALVQKVSAGLREALRGYRP